MSYNASLDALRAAFEDFSQPRYCSGTVPLTEETSKLFYILPTGKSEIVDFSKPTDGQLSTLAEACKQATFGINQEDVLDETYRKAGKLDPKNFATLFSPAASGIVDAIMDTLVIEQKEKMSLEVELYKLNVYVFRPWILFQGTCRHAQKDIMIGSLIVVLPTPHEGGSLIFRHGDFERVFDTARAVTSSEDTDKKPHAAFVAFYSDVLHEVAPVTSGYRVTLTYNLYLTEAPVHAVQSLPENGFTDPGIELLKESLAKLLADPTFLPRGGLLGFGLTHRYPFDPKQTDLTQLLSRLKVGDANMLRVCQALGLDVFIKAYYKSPYYKYTACILDQFAKFGNHEYDGDEDLIDTLRVDFNGKVVSDANEQTAYGSNTIPILWIKPLTYSNSFKTEYLAYGNESSLEYAYGEVCLVAFVKSASERKEN